MVIAQRLLSPIVDVKKDEAWPLLLMFCQSFLLMTSYNIVKPLTRAEFIDDLGAHNLPWVLLVSGVLIGLVMQAYSRAVGRLTPKAVLVTTLVGLAAILFSFWPLFRWDVPGASVAFYLLGQILGLLLISQFWMLANDIYEARQARRLFGFIGGGASLGGITGSALVAFAVDQVGTNNLLFVSGALLLLGAVVVGKVLALSRSVALGGLAAAGQETGVGRREAWSLLRESRLLRFIALIIGFAAVGAGLLEQQLNMAVEAAQGDAGVEGIAAFLGQVQLYLSVAGFVIQVGLTSRLHRHLGVGVAMLILPIGLGATSGLILATTALWAAVAGRIVDSSLRYSVDKTTRELLFLPLPPEVTRQAKAFIDVTVDRFSRGFGAAVTLILIQPWGFHLAWPQLSWLSVTISAIWIACVIRVHREYLASFRQSIVRRDVEPAEVRADFGDLATVETLIEEVAHGDESRVLYALDILDSLGKLHLVTPFLLTHPSAEIRIRALRALSQTQRDIAERLAAVTERLVRDPNPEVRAAAVSALASIRDEDAPSLARTLLHDPDPRTVVTAAVVLSDSDDPDDQATAEQAVRTLVSGIGSSSSWVRRDLAVVVRNVENPHMHELLIPLLHDPDPDVAEEAIRSVKVLQMVDPAVVPSLVSLLGRRRLKSGAREALISYGQSVLGTLADAMANPEEDVWVRRHIPATLARIPCQASLDRLMTALDADDGFLRFKALTAIEKLRREHPMLRVKLDPFERLALDEARSYYRRLGWYYNLFEQAGLLRTSVLAQAIEEKLERSRDRIFRLLGLIHPWTEVAAARAAIEEGDARARAGALEYLDNVLSGPLRSRVIPMLEAAPIEETVRRGNVILKTRPRDVEETLLELINSDDEIIAAAAIELVGALELWSLRDDVKHVLTHRDVRDQCVFEAASWTLAAYDVAPERRRESWRGALPATVVADRMRKLQLFASVSIDELFRIASAGRQTRHDPGTVFFRPGEHPQQIHVLLDGEVLTASPDSRTRTIASPAALGFEEALDGSVMRENMSTPGPAVTLTLDNDELRMLLADNTDLVQGLFRTVVDRQGQHDKIIRGGAATDPERRREGSLTTIQKGHVLRRVPLFAKVTGPEMLQLSDIADEVRLETEAPVASETPFWCFVVVLTGELRSTDDDGSAQRALPGDIVGLYETLAGLSAPMGSRRLVASEPSSILRIEHDDLFDLLGQRPDLLEQIFSAVFDRDAAVSGSGDGEPALDSPTTMASGGEEDERLGGRPHGH